MFAIDVAILRFFNRTISSGILDSVMATVTEPRNWAPVLLLFAIWISWRKGWHGVTILIGAALLVTLTDAAVHRLFKPIFMRVRPCNALDWVVTPAGGSSGLSFPSAHATNAFAVATFFSAHLRTLTPVLMAIAALVALSRVYLGLHYPSDVVGGGILGAVVALLAVRFVPFMKPSPTRPGKIGDLENRPPTA